MSQATLRRTISRIGPLQIAIIVLAVVTALVHLDRGLSMTLLAPHFAGHPAGPPPGGGHFAGRRGGGRPGGPGLLALLPVPLPVLFFCNFVGYIVLVTALYLPALRQYQRAIRWVLIIYAALTIVAWALITGAQPNVLAYIDKPIEIALIVLLLIEDRQARLQKA